MLPSVAQSEGQAASMVAKQEVETFSMQHLSSTCCVPSRQTAWLCVHLQGWEAEAVSRVGGVGGAERLVWGMVGRRKDCTRRDWHKDLHALTIMIIIHTHNTHTHTNQPRTLTCTHTHVHAHMHAHMHACTHADSCDHLGIRGAMSGAVWTHGPCKCNANVGGVGA